MDHFALKNGVLHAEDVPLTRIAEEVGTPVYVYSRATLERHARVFREGLEGVPHKLIAFAVKANPNLAVLKVLQQQGFGADVVSGGELIRALAAGMAPEMIVFSGVGKTRAELELGLDKGIGQFNIESREEGRELAELAAARGERAPACLRINPDVDAKTHEKISTGKSENKFGIPMVHAREAYDELAALEGLDLRGVAVHIGSQLLDLEPLETAFAKVGTLVEDLRAAGHTITHVDLGGGLGVPYRAGENPPS
ncbi:MAG TPA: diaminopimelate decarboxylase, partial [Erythrobacter sp.]|nr:diaminopimelate decarboxylase [Erythrobacter sp.]